MPKRNELVLSEHVYISGIDVPDFPTTYTTITVTAAGQHVRIPCLVETAKRIASSDAANERYELALVPLRSAKSRRRSSA